MTSAITFFTFLQLNKQIFSRTHQHWYIGHYDHVIFKASGPRLIEHVDLLLVERNRSIVVELDVLLLPFLAETENRGVVDKTRHVTALPPAAIVNYRV